jgi:folate-dependent phosphoribosylglycinamide formyltransferase PurN
MIEHKLLPMVINKFAEQKVIEKNNRIYILW